MKARINLGTTYFNKGLKEEAMQEYKRAIESMPDSVEAHFNFRIILYLIEGGLQEAMNEYKKVVSINPKYIAGYYNLGVIYQKLGNLNMALSCRKQTLKIDPKYAPAIQSIQKI